MNSYKENDMELCKEILVQAFMNSEAQVFFPELEVNAAEIVERACYRALNQIKAVICDDSLEDKDCFEKIERIICELEAIGSSGGNRHDFG